MLAGKCWKELNLECLKKTLVEVECGFHRLRELYVKIPYSRIIHVIIEKLTSTNSNAAQY